MYYSFVGRNDIGCCLQYTNKGDMSHASARTREEPIDFGFVPYDFLFVGSIDDDYLYSVIGIAIGSIQVTRTGDPSTSPAWQLSSLWVSTTNVVGGRAASHRAAGKNARPAS